MNALPAAAAGEPWVTLPGHSSSAPRLPRTAKGDRRLENIFHPRYRLTSLDSDAAAADAASAAAAGKTRERGERGVEGGRWMGGVRLGGVREAAGGEGRGAR